MLDQFSTYSGLAELHEKAVKHRRRAFKQLRKSLSSFRFCRLILGLEEWTTSDKWESLLDFPQKRRLSRPVTDLAQESLQRYHQQLGKQGRAFPQLDAGARRALQSDVKLLAHSGQLFAGLFPEKSASPFREVVVPLRDSLQHLADVETNRHLFAIIIDSREESLMHLVKGWQGARIDHCMQDSETAWQNFAGCAPFWL